MKREEKNAITKQKILVGALNEFSRKGYGGASLNELCTEFGVSKGIIYHYFTDRNDLFLGCAAACFDALTAFMAGEAGTFCGTLEEKLRGYFASRQRFFCAHPLELNLFAEITFNPPLLLSGRLSACRKAFDEQTAGFFRSFLREERLKDGFEVDEVVEDFRTYMDFFNARFRTVLLERRSAAEVLAEHEKRCFRQLRILLHGILR